MYETGLGVAMLLWLWNSFFLLIEINSRMERNLNKIGQRISWLTTEAKPMTAKDQQRTFAFKAIKYLLIIFIGYISAFLSWVYVLATAALVAYRLNKRSGEPSAIKEFRWKLRNIDMSFDQIVAGMMAVSGQDMNEFENVKRHMREGMEERGLL